MDKGRFLVSSPNYYALAVAVYFRNNSSAQKNKILGNYSYRDEFEETNISRLRDGALLQKAFRMLVDNRIIEIVEDDIGPQILIKSADYDDGWENLIASQPGSFGNYSKLGQDGYSWLLSALDRLNEVYEELGVTEDDFLEPDREWEPLSLDRAAPELLEAIARMDQTIEQVERDNGYAVNLPEERAYVLDSLKQTSGKLKSDSFTSLAYLRRNAFEPLLAIARRFAGAAIGATAKTAASALIVLLKNIETDFVINALKALFGIQ